MAAKDVRTYSVKQLYEDLSKQCGKDDKLIAKVLKKDKISGAAFLSLTQFQIIRLFPGSVVYQTRLQQLVTIYQPNFKGGTVQPTQRPHSPTAFDQPPPSYSQVVYSESLPSSLKQLSLSPPGLPTTFQQVQVGPPAVYKLEPQQRCIDEKCQISSYVMDCVRATDTLHKVLMIVGGTGTGKSTMINALTNYFLGVTFSDSYRYTIITHNDEGGRSQVQSQTTWVKAYTFHKQPSSPVPYDLTIIDTPGYGDTTGIERDYRITNQIKDFFQLKELGIDHVNAVAFVVKADERRLNAAQKYIFTELLKLFGKDIAPAVMIVATHAGVGQENEAEPALKEVGVPVNEKRTYLVDNSALFKSNVKNTGTVADSSVVGFRKFAWNNNEHAFARMTAAIGQMENVSLSLSIMNLEEREGLMAILKGIGPKIQEYTTNTQNIQKLSDEIKKNRHDMDNNKDFSMKVTETVPKKVIVELKNGKKSFNCRTCETMCHFPCTAGWKRSCRAIAFFGGDCRVCKNKCSLKKHNIDSFKYKTEYVERVTQMTGEQLEKQIAGKVTYLTAEADASKSSRILAKLKKDQQELIINCSILIREAKGYSDRIREISLHPSPSTEEDYIEEMMQNERDERGVGWQGRVSALKQLKEISKLIHKVDHLTEDNIMDILPEQFNIDPLGVLQ